MVSDNNLSKSVKIYKDVVLRGSTLKDDTICGDNSFVDDSALGQKVTIERRSMIFSSHIDDYSTIGFNSVIRNASIGKFCSIAWNVSVGAGEHNMNHLSTHLFPTDIKYGFLGYPELFFSDGAYDKSVLIGNDVWVAANAQVLRGVTVDDGAVIGAGAVVTHNVGKYEIWAGVPARKIGQRFSDEIIQSLSCIKWWDFPVELIKENIDLFRHDVTIDTIEKLKELKLQIFK